MPTRFARHRSRLRVGAAAIALGALGVMAAVALAANPVSGAKYKGHIENNPVNTKISFKVSGNGTKVRHLKTKLDPIFNAAQCGGTTSSVTQKSKPAHISGKGKFRGVIRYTYPDSGGTHGKAIVKGRFHSNGTEGGKVIATFHNPDCNGTGHYSTKAQ
jgi:hypothetical protein